MRDFVVKYPHKAMIESSVRIHGSSCRELSVGARQWLVDSELPFGSCAQNDFSKGATVCPRHRATH